MKNKKRSMAGYTLIVVGITMLICTLIFVFLGYRIFLKSQVEFEQEQSLHTSTRESDKISIPGFEAWTIEAGEEKVSTHFYNPEQNTCYFVLTVTLDETDEVIYESKYLKPGQHLYEVELTKALEAGEYQATLHYSTYAIHDLSPQNGANLPFSLIVKG